ncbi:unnamed protein product, partial [Ostreobium quekettii]
GFPAATWQAVRIILMAVHRYKELTEGRQLGRSVYPVQVVEGVEFLYRPPPKNKVPQAASVWAFLQSGA